MISEIKAELHGVKTELHGVKTELHGLKSDMEKILQILQKSPGIENTDTLSQEKCIEKFKEEMKEIVDSFDLGSKTTISDNNRFLKSFFCKKVINETDGKHIIDECEKYATEKGWSKKIYQNKACNAVSMDNITTIGTFMSNFLYKTIFPKIIDFYQIKGLNICFKIVDLAFIKSSMTQIHILEKPNDRSFFTFQIVLQEEDATIRFENTKEYTLSYGDILLYSGNPKYHANSVSTLLIGRIDFSIH